MTLSYASLAEIKEEVKTQKTEDDGIVLRYGGQASQRIDRLFQSQRTFFMPYIENRSVPIYSGMVNSNDGTLDIGRNLLALTTLTAGETVVTDVEVYPPYTSPSHLLRLTGTTGCYSSWYSYQSCNGGGPLTAVVNGVWGFHRDYANAWLEVDALEAAITTTTATTFTVDNHQNFSPGQLVKIDTEFMEVTATGIVASNPTVTVKRGVNGSTKATHLIAAPVYVWQVEEPIKRAVARQAAFMYARRGTYESSVVNELGMIQFPADLLSEVYGVVQGYAYS